MQRKTQRADTKRTVAIIGYGYVGRGTERFFKDTFDIVIYDPHKGHDDKEVVNNADLAVISVPTVMNGDGTADLSAVHETFGWIKTPAIVIKSTVPPGTTKELANQYDMHDRLVFSPEFIGERGYPVPFWEDVPHPTDMKLHSFFIFGGSKEANKKVVRFFEEVSGAHARYVQTDSTSAELTKYMINNWIAAKVTFCNEWFDIANTFGVDYKELRELWLLDGRVGRSHTIVYEDMRGFGGKCIPKDTNAIVQAAKKTGYEAKLMRSILKVNEELIKKRTTNQGETREDV